MIGLEDWFASGQHVAVVLPGHSTHNLFCRVSGSGPWITLLHGFPTCSWDWAAIADALASEHRLLMPDLLGFGDSDKPTAHHYTLVEQADIVAALWRHHDIRESVLIAHDIGGSVAQELLARQSEARLSTRVTRAIFLNGGLYADLARPRAAQKLLAQRLLGPLLARLMTERIFTRNLAAVFSKAHRLSPATASAYWAALRRHSGPAHIHRLLQYMPERQQQRARWETALERTTVPLHFVWGMQDPVAGAAVAEHIRTRVPAAHVVALDDTGHYPQLEIPERVQAELTAALRSPL